MLTALASAAIAASGITGSNEAALIVWYGLLATMLVWLPVLGYLLLGADIAPRAISGRCMNVPVVFGC